MSTPNVASIVSNQNTSSAKKSGIDSTAEAAGSLTPELVIALCGPIGSPLHQTSDIIKSELSNFGYEAVQIRLSELIRINADLVHVVIDNTSKHSEIKSLIKAGDELRKLHQNDVLAKLAIAKISADRTKKYGEFEDRANEAVADIKIKTHRICHIIDSVKNVDELKLLRLIYGEALISIGVFSPLETRKKNMLRPGHLIESEIIDLIDTDSGEEFAHGQSVRDTFPQCDLFLRVDKQISGASEIEANAQISTKIQRFFNLIFRTIVVSPTHEENAMYSAASASRNSACLSRQVGAAVTSSSGELLSVGWNDVPNSGGGLYGKPRLNSTKNELALDDRCYAQSGAKCHNDLEKKTIAEKIIESLIKDSLVVATNKEEAVNSILNDTRIKDLIEFSRAVHAEMHAILGASRVAGDRILNGKIFVTTYPCHSCARHIVASGIAEIYYIEPYRKSLATRLHSDSLSEAIDSKDLVKLLQFDGVAPRRFIDFFESGSRKRNGVLTLPARDKAIPTTQVSLRAIPRLEAVVVAEISIKSFRLPELLSKEVKNDEENKQTT